ncbi:hypothetical protein [Geobacter sp. AOG2]|uniref:hypothetical protein n=1 Tax=Geobacter sp. AOG2 TaxID=1566347 RepID=UPI001CC51AAA|nr:hypothetical protein [Geobacter sp. AOG2]GFE62917.1 hypothetical protein AOG2_35060 [Geobacter sp. AOG2]
MTISPITTGTVTAAYTAPAVQQAARAPQQAPKTDTVTISPQARQLASDGDPAALEAQESATEKVSESARGKA